MDAGDLQSEVQTERVPVFACPHCSRSIDASNLEAFAPIECPECGAGLHVPARLGAFLLLRLLGKGGMSAVYEAYDEKLGRAVALKVLRRALSTDAQFLETLRREAQMAAALNHPHVAQIYSLTEEGGQPCIVMELVPGERLDEMIEGRSPLEEALVVQVALDVAEGLRAADEIGLIHGDIKPENILLDAKGRAKLVDFGIASFAGGAQAQKGIWGTPYYIAPEKVLQKPVTSKADMYSLGGTLYHALSGVPPFDGPTPIDVVKARLKQEPRNLKDVRPDLHQPVVDAVHRMLQVQPAMRHATYASLIADLQAARGVLASEGKFAILGGKQKKTIIQKRKRPDGALRLKQVQRAFEPPAAAAEAAPPARKRTRGWIIAGMAAVLLVAGGAFGFLQYQSHVARKGERGEVRSMLDELGGEIARADASLQAARRQLKVLNAQSEQVKEIVKTCPDSVKQHSTAAADALAGAAKKVAYLEQVAGKQARDRDAIRPSAAPSAVRAAVQEMAAARKVMRDTEAEVTASLAAAKVSLEKAIFEKKGWDADRQAKELRSAQDEEEARRRQKEEEARRAEQAKKETAAKEMEQAAAAHKEAMDGLKKNDFAAACASLEKSMGAMQTEDARRALQVVLERYQAMRSLKSFIVAELSAKGFPWGWGSGSAALDVLSATDAAVTVKGGREIPWSAVGTVQMLKFADHFVAEPGQARDQQAERLIAMAVFCYETGQASEDSKAREAARKFARDYVARALELKPAFKTRAEGLMPALSGQDQPAAEQK